MARIKIDGDAAGFVAAQRKVREETRRADNEFNKVLETNRELERQVKRTWEQARTPLERYTDRVRRLQQLRKDNRITEAQYTDALRRTQDAYRRLSKEQQATFGARAIRNVTGYLASIDAVGAAINVVEKAYQRLDERQARQADRERERLQNLLKLYTLPGAVEERRGYVQQALQLERGGFGGDAAGAIFALQSADVNRRENRRLLQELGRVPGYFGDPQQTSQVLADAAKVATNFPDVETLNEAMGRLEAASGVTQATIERFGKALPTVAGEAAQVGLEAPQTMAALSVLSDALKSPDVAAEKFKGLIAEFREVGRDLGLTGTLDERIRTIQSMVDEDRPLQDIFGRETAQTAATFLMRDRGEMLRRARIISAAPGIRESLRAPLTDPELGPIAEAEHRRRMAQFRGREGGRRRVSTDVVRESLEAGMGERGVGPVAQYLAAQIGRYLQTSQASGDVIQAGMGITGGGAEGFAPDVTGGIVTFERGIQALIRYMSGTEQNTRRSPSVVRSTEN